jgi:hypothetical protein
VVACKEVPHEVSIAIFIFWAFYRKKIPQSNLSKGTFHSICKGGLTSKQLKIGLDFHNPLSENHALRQRQKNPHDVISGLRSDTSVPPRSCFYWYCQGRRQRRRRHSE